MTITTFSLASCQYPADMFERMPDGSNQPDGPFATRGPADASLLALGKLVDPTDIASQRAPADPPTLLLLVGDQVYTDATAGLFDPKVVGQLWQKCLTRSDDGQFSNSDNMAVVGILSAQLLHQQLVEAAPSSNQPTLKTLVER